VARLRKLSEIEVLNRIQLFDFGGAGHGCTEIIASTVDENRRFHSLTRSHLWVGVFGQAAVDTTPCKTVVIPPFCKEPFTASWTGESQRQVPRDDCEDHPPNRDYESRSKR
ncbi:MAG TPA: hypothetical protein VK198_17150, partial [Terriglobales bacterium]|nr:hypothetical protein [Terriglobales bacterium]